MSRSLGVLTLDLIARTGGFEQGMDRASRRVRSTAQDMEAAKRVADRYIMAIGAAGVAFASAAAAMAVSAAKSMDATAKMAQQIGTTTEALTGMRFAAQQFANISDQQFDMAMRRMTRRIAEAAEGGGAAKGALEAMGLSARQLAQLAPEKQMLAIADAMHRTERQADRLRYTMAIFDTEGMPLVSALQQGSAAFEQNIELAKRFGVVLSTEAAQAAEQFTSNMSLLSEAQKGFKNQLAEAVLPLLADLSGRLVEIARRVGPMGDAIEKALKAAGVAAAATAAIFVSRLIGSITASVAAWTAATAEAARYQMTLARMAASAAGASTAITAMTGAAAGGMAVMGRAAQLALGVLGGPAGLLVTTGLTAAAFLALGRDARTASVDIDELSESFKTLSAQKLELRMFDLEDEVKRLEDQARESGEILRTMEADVAALFEDAAKGVNITTQELENARRALLEQRDAHDTNNAELERARTLLNQVIDHLERLKGAAHGAAGGVEALNRAMHSEAGEKYLAQLQGQIKALQDGGDPIKMAARWISEHADATDADKAAIMSAAHALKALQDARDKASRSTSAAAKALAEAQRAAQNFRREQDQSLRSQLQSVSAIHSQAQAVEDQVAVYGLGKTAIEDLTIARLEEQAAMLQWFEGSEEVVEGIKREIEARKRLRTAVVSLEQKEAERRAWEDWARDVEQIFDRVGQSLTDAIFDGAKNGKELLRDLFKSLTFNVLINPIMNQMQGWVTNQLGGLFGVQNPQQGGMLGTAQNLYSGYNAITGGLNSTLGNAAQWMGQKIGSEALTSFGLGLSGAFTATTPLYTMASALPATAAWAGTAAGLTSALPASLSIGSGLTASLGTTVGTAGAGAAAGGAAGFGAALGSALPWIGGALALSSAFGLFDDRLPTTRRSKQGASHMLPDGTFEVSSWDSRQDAASQEAARDFAQAAVKHANDLFEHIGVDAGIQSFHTLMESSILGDKQGVGSSGQVRIGDVLREIGLTVEPSWTKHGVGGWSDAEMLPRLQADIQLTLLEAFQAAGDELPDLLSSMLEGADIRGMAVEQALELSAAFNQMVEAISGFRDSLENLPFTQLRDLSFDAAANLIQFAGGLEQLDAGMTSYFQNFYSQEEQLAHQTEQLNGAFDELGLTMPDVTQGADAAKQAYRAIVESLDVTTEEGQRAYATLMTLSGGFHELITGMDRLAAASEQAAEQQRRAAEQLMQALAGDVSGAFNSVVQAGQREIARLQESFARTDALMSAYRTEFQRMESEFNGLFSSIERGIQALRGSGAAFEADYHRARAVISTTLLTGQLPQTADLNEAIRVAQQGVTNQRYSSAFEQRNAYMRLANELQGLKDIAQPELDTAKATLEQLEEQYRQLRGIEDVAGKSLSQIEKQTRAALAAEEVANRQISLIERQIEQAQRQHNTLLGIEDGVLSFTDALIAFATAADAMTKQVNKNKFDPLAYLAANPDVAKAYRDYGTHMTPEQFARDHYRNYGQYEDRPLGNVVPSTDSTGSSKTGSGKTGSSSGPKLSREEQYLINNPDVMEAYLKGYGSDKNMTPEQLARYHYETYGKKEGRSFDVGTPYVPYDMLANIHQGEIIIDPRSSDILRRYGIGVQGGGNKELVAEVRQLRAEVAGLRAENKAGQFAIAKYTQKAARIQEKWDAIGMPQEVSA